jgi:uncharacterized protein with FMN-binding domain
MRKKIVTIALAAYAVAIPVSGVAAATRVLSKSAAATKLTATVTRKLTGVDALAGQWGSVQVVITLRTTTVGSKSRKKYTDLGGRYSYHTSRSQYIMSQALPLLRQEFLQVQDIRKMQNVSGATYTSNAFAQSLQSALLKASK